MNPKLARRARLRWDAVDARWMLLYPERGLVLNTTAAEVAKLCDGTRSADEIVAVFAGKVASAAGEIVEKDVRAFLAALADRGLLE